LFQNYGLRDTVNILRIDYARIHRFNTGFYPVAAKTFNGTSERE